MAAVFEGKQLLTKDGTSRPASELLAGRYVALYFSAHWCPPCKRFTPELAKAYTEHFQAKDLEIVFVSSDKDQKSFDEYYGEMPWLALPYEDRAMKAELATKFKVKGIPMLVVLDKDGSVITTDGRSQITEDPKGEQFPSGWKPPALSEVLAKMPIQAQDGSVTRGVPSTQFLMLYFSAHWCPPCRAFTPKFAEVYKKLKAAGKDFETVFISSDREQSQFEEYFATHPWCSLSFEDRATKAQLSKIFDVSGIPSLIVLERQANGEYATVNDDCVGLVAGDPEGANFPYFPPLVHNAADDLGPINELPCVCALAEFADDAATKQLEATLTTVAQRQKDRGERKVGFLLFGENAGQSAGVGKILRKKAAEGKIAEDAGTHVLIVDVQGDKMYLYQGELSSADAVEAWVATYTSGKPEQSTLLNVSF